MVTQFKPHSSEMAYFRDFPKLYQTSSKLRHTELQLLQLNIPKTVQYCNCKIPALHIDWFIDIRNPVGFYRGRILE